jgi:hypothetical protein
MTAAAVLAPRARRQAMALGLAQLPAPWRQHLTWQDLARLPAWLVRVPAATLPALALWCGALWHGPALRQAVEGGTLQAARELLGPDGLQAVQAQAALGRIRVLPAVARLDAVWRSCGWDLLRADVAAALESAADAQELACRLLAHRAGEGGPLPSPGPGLTEVDRAQVQAVVACACDLLAGQATVVAPVPAVPAEGQA